MLYYLCCDEDTDFHIFLSTTVYTVNTCERSRQEFMEPDYGRGRSYPAKPGTQTAADQQAVVP